MGESCEKGAASAKAGGGGGRSVCGEKLRKIWRDKIEGECGKEIKGEYVERN